MNKALDISCLSLCKKCVTLGEDHVPASGNPSAEIMFIGQSPGEQEVKKGKPFVGASGEVLDFFLDELGMTREEVYITNALKCHPPGNRPGHEEELDLCFSTWLKKEIKFLNPKVVVLLGKDAWQSVTGGRIPFEHGKFTKSKKRVFLTLYHPGYFLRRGDIETFIAVAKELKKEYEGLI